MKRSCIFALCLTLGLSYGLSRNVTLKADGENAEIVFANIMKQTGKNFIYSPDVLKGMKVTVDAVDLTLEQTLKKIFSGTDVEFRIKGNNVVLSKRKTQPSAPVSFTISGFVREEGSGEPVAGAVVTVGSRSTITNAYGFYSLPADQGLTKVEVSGFGFLSSSTSPFDLHANKVIDFSLSHVKELKEVVVTGSRRKTEALDATSVGSLTLSSEKIRKTPVVFGESDIIKTLQLEPGIAAGVEGFAGMYVHGGNSDENLYMLDNIPLYQVNHLGGLFSAFNSEVMRNVDFYKSSFPARYDGRLSSFMDVHTKDGSTEKTNGSFTLGLISGAFDINGPIGKDKRTTYSIGLRRSWLDLLAIPTLAVLNATVNKEEKTRARYDLTDLNAKITHRFSDRTKAWFMIYYGEDYLLGGSRLDWTFESNKELDDIYNRLYWGNLVTSVGTNHVFSPNLFGDFSLAYTRYFSKLKGNEDYKYWNNDKVTNEWHNHQETRNNIDDWIARADFDWRPSFSHRVNFGAGLTLHSFLPEKSSKSASNGNVSSTQYFNAGMFRAFEANGYIGDDWKISERWRADAGIHLSLFHIDGKTHHGISPRISLRYNPSGSWALKGSFSRTVQYVHQLSKTFISLPTDQWVPITGNFKPQTADKISAGIYWMPDSRFSFSMEPFFKWMNNLMDYSDLFYITNQTENWGARLCSGSGTSKGIDFKITKESGKVTGQIAYSLLWADRKFAGKNGGMPFPARFDNRHKINVSLNWKINGKWDLNCAWTGMSGNRFTLASQEWLGPELYDSFFHEGWGIINSEVRVSGGDVPLIRNLNNYRLPFYHRLDLSVVRQTKRGYWTISVFNAYCNRNTVAIRYGNRDGKNVFQKLSLFPIIPSFSYTWKF